MATTQAVVLPQQSSLANMLDFKMSTGWSHASTDNSGTEQRSTYTNSSSVAGREMFLEVLQKRTDGDTVRRNSITLKTWVTTTNTDGDIVGKQPATFMVVANVPVATFTAAELIAAVTEVFGAFIGGIDAGNDALQANAGQILAANTKIVLPTP